MTPEERRILNATFARPRSPEELRDLYGLAQRLIATTPPGEDPPEAHVMLWMAMGYALGHPEHAHLPSEARAILAARGE